MRKENVTGWPRWPSRFPSPTFTVIDVKADDKIPNIAGIKFPTYNTMRGAMVRDYKRGNF
ncbi:MAG: hypothetical protein BAA00_15790 [Parageobacillus thermoglucosidasius]|jgi:predicted Fe-Mo cluster-binding NifX family protein|nr:MAG: hypothetical protein BAA00_15790 [Parageobacillus thermoglucosidasius]